MLFLNKLNDIRVLAYSKGFCFRTFRTCMLQGAVHGKQSCNHTTPLPPVCKIVHCTPVTYLSLETRCCPSLLSVAMIDAVTKNNLGREGFVWLPHPCHTVRHAEKPGQELKERPWRSSAYRLALHALLCLISYYTP